MIIKTSQNSCGDVAFIVLYRLYIRLPKASTSSWRSSIVDEVLCVHTIFGLEGKSICASAENFDISISAAPKLAQLTLTGISISHSCQRGHVRDCHFHLCLTEKARHCNRSQCKQELLDHFLRKVMRRIKIETSVGATPTCTVKRFCSARLNCVVHRLGRLIASRSSPRPRDAQFLASVSGIPAPAA